MKNLQRIFERTDDTSKAEGLEWYQQAHEFCKQVSLKYNVELPKVCGILSALSPATNWEANKRDCINLIKVNGNAYSKQFKFTTYGQNVLKAQDIFRSVINPDNAFNPKTGAKTYNFYHNVLHPTNETYVTIDRHAYTIATNNVYKHLTPKQYGIVADHYRRSADKVKLLPNQLQAILWVSYRKQQDISFNIHVPF